MVPPGALWGQALYFHVLELAPLFDLSFDRNIKIQGLPPIPGSTTDLPIALTVVFVEFPPWEE
jgi:hypothetical protein